MHKTDFPLETRALRCLHLTETRDSERHNTRFACFTDTSQLPEELSEVPSSLWAAHKYDVGLIKGAEPVKITPKSDIRPNQPQYPLKPEAVEGITPVFDSLLEAGVIVPCPDSPVRTPMFPVKKARVPPQRDDWRFVQDLRAVNAAVHARAPNVPNPHTILSQIPTEFLSSAFFSVPVDPDSQFWFAFEFNGKPYTFTRLCQGYCESPTIFNAALRDSLASLQLSKGSALLQYVDDLLIAAPTEEQCRADSVSLLKHLAAEGHKASLQKMQYCQNTVTFLGHVISGQGRTLSQKRIGAISSFPKPRTKKQLMSFLGLCGYCRNFVPNFSILEKPMRELIHKPGMAMSSQLAWSEAAEHAFTAMKKALQSPPTLGIPDPTKPLVQAVDEREGCMTSVLLQKHGTDLRPVGYFSAKLDPVAAGLPKCLRATAASEKARYRTPCP